MTDENISYGEAVELNVDDAPVRAFRGQTIAAALLASGTHVFRHTRVNGKARGLYCGMGVCYDCIVRVNGSTERACMTHVEDGMQISLPKRFSTGETNT
jgi:predicted molibdopterin-dependent oxidoreductase YjgC